MRRMANFDNVIQRLIIGRKKLKLTQEKASLLYKLYEVVSDDIKHHVSTIDYLERMLHRLIDEAGEKANETVSIHCKADASVTIPEPRVYE